MEKTFSKQSYTKGKEAASSDDYEEIFHSQMERLHSNILLAHSCINIFYSYGDELPKVT